MQLTRFTDLALRVLMYLSGPERDEAITIGEIAARFEVSHHHLTKVVQFMAQQGWLLTTRGKGGGLALARPASEYRLGTLLRTLEGHPALINCSEPPCALLGRCGLQGLLAQALDGFYAQLDQHTLADALGGSTQQAIVSLHQLHGLLTDGPP